MKVYFDNAASTPLIKEVSDEMCSVATENFGNPSSIHSYGREARVIVENARETIAKCIRALPSEIFFTSGGTEAINTVIRGYIYAKPLIRVITSRLEHYAVLNCLTDILKEKKIQIEFLPHDSQGNIDHGSLETVLGKYQQALVILMHANNETGNILHVQETGAICREYGAFFMSDTVQTIGKIPVSPDEMNADSIICSAHKLHGPKGAGFFYLRKGEMLHPLLFGGSQERNKRAGTENVPAIAGMAKALEIACDNMEKNHRYILHLKTAMIKILRDSFQHIEFNGNTDKNGLHSILSVSFPLNDKTEMLQYNLDINGIAVSGGSACTSGSAVPSHVISELKGSRDLVTIRFSFSKFNTLDEVNYCTEVMKKTLG